MVAHKERAHSFSKSLDPPLNRITFKIKTGYCLELLTPKKMKSLGRTKSNITKNENGKNAPNLEITKVVSV